MENLVCVINRLQDVFSMVGADTVHLPQIVVVGTQSSGKSSVLESIVGRSFLPRGAGVVTRRPIILQLAHCPVGDPLRGTLEGTPKDGDWAVFLHDKLTVFTDYHAIRAEIENETDRKAGPNKGICAEPIVLKIFSDRVLNLTIVDLPGITKVPVGDQPADIEKTVRELILQYIKNPNSIILAIVTANTDMATSESLKIAKEVDPEGERTLAVVTKLDLMDEGTDAMEVLCGRVIPVKLGIIGVVNRSQRDIQINKEIREAIRDEMIFLRKKYPTIAQKHGSSHLAKTLQSLLMGHIQSCLPDLKFRVSSLLTHYQSLLASYGEVVASPKETLLNALTRFTASYCNTIQGTYNVLETKELGGGARINFIFHESFGRALNDIDPLAGFDRVAIMTAIRNASGAKPSLFIPESCFELLVKMQIKKLEPPSLRCVELVYDEMERIVSNCGAETNMIMKRFPNLCYKIKEITSSLLKNRIPITCKVVEDLIGIHTAYINTGHSDFVKETVKFCPSPHSGGAFGQVRGDPSERALCKSVVPSRSDNYAEEREVPRDCAMVEKLITVYFNIIRKTVQDCVPKIIMRFMVNYAMENLLSELVGSLYSDGDYDFLLIESPAISQRRLEANRMLEALRKANSIIGEIKETAWLP